MSVRCTPFCSPCNKGYKHHELLLALLNTQDFDQGTGDIELGHQRLNSVINKYKAKGWDHNSEIWEENEEFRFPLLHWACVLGKIRTVQWLLDNGFNSNVQTKDTYETCLHRFLVTLPDTSKSGHVSVAKFKLLLPNVKDCLAMGNHRQDTPLHVAARFMAQNRSYCLYENVFLNMLEEIEKWPLRTRQKCLNCQNLSGDTVLNLLSSCSKSLAVIEKLVDAGADSMIVNKLNIGPLNNAQSRDLEHIANFLKSSLLRGCGVLPQAQFEKKLLNEESRKRRSERRSTYNTTLASLNMFCREEANDFIDNSQGSQLSSPTRGSEKSSKSTEFEELDNLDSRTTEDEDSTSQSSYFSSMILRNVKDKNPTTVEFYEDFEKPSTLKPGKAHVKEDHDGLELCTCCGEDDENTNHKKDHDAAGSSKDEPLLLNPEVKLFDVMKEAGVLPNLTDVITKTKEEHLNRIYALEKSMRDILEKQEKQQQREKEMINDISRKKRELEKLKCELSSLRAQKSTASNKRKLLEEESQDLRRKVISCESLLKNVPSLVTSKTKGL